MQRDDIFGNIEWTGENWTTSVSIPSLRGFGDRLELTAEDREEIGPEEEFKLTIDTVDEARKPPTAGQRAAWKKVTEGGEAIWEEVLDALVAEYQLQRPMRARYWKAIRGTRHLERSLPPVVNRAVMKELVAPVRFGVHAPDSEHGSVDVYVSYVATWWSEGIHVYIRDGLVREVTAQGAMHHLKLPYQDIPHLGTLRRGPKSKAWSGSIRLEAFQDFAAIAVDRSSWDESYGRVQEAMSDLPWDVARGSASLRVYAGPRQPPTARQAAAFEVFRNNQRVNAGMIINSVFKYYQETFEARRDGYLKRGDPSASDPARSSTKAQKPGGMLANIIGGMFERLLDTAPAHDLSPSQRRSLVTKTIPALQEAPQLSSITELRDINIFPDEGSAPVPIGFLFSGPWIGDAGLGVRWRDGKVEEVGAKDIASVKTAGRA